MSKSYPFLAASPDDIIDVNSIAEVKCISTSKHEKITEESVSFLKSANDSLKLEKSHDLSNSEGPMSPLPMCS